MSQLATIPPHPGVRKAAVLMVLLGDEAATAIYRCLPRTEVQRLTEEISELSFVAPMEAHTVLEEYNQLLLTHTYLAQGGTEYANNLLVQAFGEKDARALLSQVLEAQEARAGNLDSLQQADPPQLAKFLQDEHPQTIAVILAHLGVRAASSLLALLPDKVSADAVKRLAEMRQFSPEMAEKISMVLHRKFEGLGEKSRRAYAGVKAVADILNRTDLATSKMVLENIEKNDPAMALSIRDLMFTFEDMVSVPEASLREWLSAVDKRTLALALKGAPGDLRTHVMQAMSSRAAEMLQEDMEALGPVRARDVLRAQQDAVTLARKLEQEGKVTLKADHNEEFIV
ncbi:MAG TPA: flagellar motor switch protein FliG, partial [Terriglobales bacterium]|nr:flagellar motor switch protein FliG [Terriglobales bacterium]